MEKLQARIETYPEIKIGSQIWMRGNLSVLEFSNGDTIPQARTNEEWFEAIERIKNKYKLDDDFVSELLQLFRTNRQQGVHILNSENKRIHVRDIAEQHILEDFRGKFMPNVSD